MKVGFKAYYAKGSFKLEKVYGTDAGYDIRCLKDQSVKKDEVSLFDTGIHLNLPKNIACIVMNKSGLGSKGLYKTSELIDCGYNGSIKIALNYNGQNGDYYSFKAGDKVAQLIFINVYDINFEEVDSVEEFNSYSDRGDKGFGSSGK